MPFQPGRDLLQGVASRNLRLTPPVGESTDARMRDNARGGAFDLERREPCIVYRLERQRLLKTRLGCGIELASGLERPLAIELEAIALKTQRLPRPGQRGDACRRRRATLLTRLAQLFRSFASTAAGKCNPLVLRVAESRLRAGHRWSGGMTDQSHANPAPLLLPS